MKNSHNANQSLETCNIQKVGKNSIEDQLEVDLHENNYINSISISQNLRNSLKQ